MTSGVCRYMCNYIFIYFIILANWREKLLSKREWFLEDAQYRADEKKYKNLSKTNNNNNDNLTAESTDGSFRKLDFD